MINYSKHISDVRLKLATDDRLTPYHISLYLALFSSWHPNSFTLSLHVVRKELMRMSHIRLNRTYTRCMRNLHEWNYIVYQPLDSQDRHGAVGLVMFNTNPDDALQHT